MNNFNNSRKLQIAGLLLGMLVWLANNSNPPNGRTGAPFDSTCGTSNCHGTSNTNGYNCSASIDGLPGTIQANTVYPLTLTVNVTAGSPVEAGFQLVAVATANNANAGDLAAANTQTGTEMFGGREYIEQRGGKAFSGGTLSWTFNWTAPGSITGSTITFYYIINLTNNNNNNSGDYPISFSETFAFSGPPPIAASINTTTNPLCNGSATGSATVEATGGVTPYTYLWSNGQTSQTAINLAAGTYTVTVTGAQSSGTATASTIITQPAAITASASSSNTISCAVPEATLTATAAGGTGSLSYQWSNGQSGSQTTVTAAGTYTVTVSDNNSCTKTASVVVTGNTTAPNAAASANGSISCSQPTVSLSCSGSSVGGIYTYLWTTPDGNIVSGNTSCNPVVNLPGTYTLRVTNTSNGCTNTASTTVTSSVTPPGATASASGSISCTNTTVTLNGNSPTSGVNYLWSGPGGFTSTQQNPTTTTAGNYTLVVTNPANSCTSSASVNVASTVNPPGATASVSGGPLTCANTSVTLNGNSQTVGVNYNWSGPNNFTSTLQNPVVSVAGGYIVTVTNPVNGCTSSATATVTANTTPPNVTATGGPTITCVTTGSQVFGNSTTSGVTYAWSGPDNFASSQQNPIVSLSGVYTLTATAPNGCVASDTAIVNQNTQAPTATAGNGILTCAATSVTLEGGTNAAQPVYFWTGPDGATSTQPNYTATIAGTYTLVVTNTVNGCTASTTATVTTNTTPPTAVATSAGNLNCINSTIQLNGSGSSQGPGYTYAWTTQNGNIISGATTLTPLVDAPGTYQLLVFNGENGCTNTASTTVVQSPAVTASLANAANVSCNGGSNGSATVVGGGGNGTYTYLWSNGATTGTTSNLPAGVYLFTVTDGEGCSASSSVTITQPDALNLTASATGETALGANNGTAYAIVSGGTLPYSFLWNTGATTDTIFNLTPGSYSVTTTDGNGCTANQTVTVNSFNCNLSAAISSTNVTCNGANNGSATVSTNGAVEPVVFTWSNGGTGATQNNLAPGAYSVSLVDANGCPASLSTTINEPTAVSPNATATGETSAGSNNGTATAQPTGGTSPYSFNWNTGANTASISNLAPGVYTVTITDASNCSASQSVTVSAFNCAITASITAANAICAGSATGQATAFVSGGTAPFGYNWNNGAATATVTNLAAGVYTVTVSDAAGCITTASTSVDQPLPLSSAVAFVNNPVCAESPTGSAGITVNGGTTPYNITWPNNTNGQNLTAGTYAVSITDTNGCFTEQSVTLTATDNEAPTLACPDNITLCGADIVSYPQPVASDNCSLGSNQPVLVSGLASGSAFDDGVTTQVYQVTDANGNTGTCSFTVTVFPLSDILVDGSSNDVGDAGVGTIHITPSGGTAPFAFTWNKDGQFFSHDEDLTGLHAGSYTLTMTDANGCSVALAPIVITNTVGAGEPGLEQSLKLIPNPAHSTFRVEIIGNISIAAARILDLQGRLVQEIQPADLPVSVEVEQLSSGLYYLSVVTEDGKVQVLKFVKAD